MLTHAAWQQDCHQLEQHLQRYSAANALTRSDTLLLGVSEVRSLKIWDKRAVQDGLATPPALLLSLSITVEMVCSSFIPIQHALSLLCPKMSSFPGFDCAPPLRNQKRGGPPLFSRRFHHVQ